MAENNQHSHPISSNTTALSIVIVSYNVKYFLRQCIESIYRSRFDKDYKIVVVDNDSKDGSVEMVQSHFPEVICLANSDNVGFGKANNQGFEAVDSKYVLILNPDTIVQENTFQVCYDYLESHDSYGAVGVKLIDGAGNFLPESKRGFPTPLNALFKLTGLAKLFSKSSFFNSYYQGQDDAEHTCDTNVLTGAFTFIRKSLLSSIGGYDEDYFMYGEDIEMSYQIKSQGQKIAYLPTTSIIHFKGESTTKNSVDYIKNFYGAMGIYANKRNKGGSGLWKFILSCGIIISALAGITKGVGRYLIRPSLDFLVLFFGAKFISQLWALAYFDDPNYYNSSETDISIAIASFVLIVFYAFFGQYDKRHNLKHLIYGFVFGALAFLSIYGLFPLELRFSRFVLLSIVVLSPIIFYITRLFYNKLSDGSFSFDTLTSKRIAIVGAPDSCEQVQNVIAAHLDNIMIIGHINAAPSAMGAVDDMYQIVESRKINELVFCSKDLDGSYMLNAMATLGNKVSYKIAADDNKSFLGSDSKNEVGEWYTMDIGFKIDQVFHRRSKRCLDVLVSIALIVLSPIIFLISKQRMILLKNLLPVLFGSKTWIAYRSENLNLPHLRKGVFPPQSSDIYYARNYSVWMELENVMKAIFL